jgi:acetyltransferase-like isoleucine patch superfamily enzyme
MVVVRRLAPYSDADGNEIVYAGPPIEQNVTITFRGGNNRVEVADRVRLGSLAVTFDCSDGLLQIRRSKGVPAFSATIRVGQDCVVSIGRDVSSTTAVGISATEGTRIAIGDDVMFASGNEVRADDGHPIFDVVTGRRVNVSRSISIGNHVWVGRLAVILGGSRIGEGSVLGYGTLVKGEIPNNCIAVGVPARIARRDIAWERPHLSLTKPYYKPDASTVAKSPYWNRTRPVEPTEPTGRTRRLVRRLVRRSSLARRVVRSAPVRRLRAIRR